MTSQNPDFKKFEKRLEGEPVVVGEYTIQPVAQAVGWRLTAQDETSKGAGGWIRIKPVEVIVGKGEDQTYLVPITNEKQEAMKGIGIAALSIAALCWFVIIGVTVSKYFKEKEK